MPFGEWLTEQVNKRGWTGSSLAARMKVRPSTVYRWMSNKRRMGGEYVVPLAEALGMHPDEVFAARGLRELDRPARDYAIIRAADQVTHAIERFQEEVSADGKEVRIPLIGRVPADAVRWTAVREGEVVRVPQEWLEGMRAPFAVIVSGECLSNLKIHDGDTVICDDLMGEEPPEGEVTLVRIGDERTFKKWYRVSPTAIELRDGAGNVIYRLTEHDDFDVLGIAVHRKGGFK